MRWQLAADLRASLARLEARPTRREQRERHRDAERARAAENYRRAGRLGGDPAQMPPNPLRGVS